MSKAGYTTGFFGMYSYKLFEYTKGPFTLAKLMCIKAL